MCIKPGIINTEWERLRKKMEREKRRTNIIFLNREKKIEAKTWDTSLFSVDGLDV